MARKNPEPIQQYRGSTAQTAVYTGPEGELTVDTEKKAVVVHDGVTAGGHYMARDADVVHLAGAETITGVKTFGEVHNTMTTEPTDTEVANVGYVKSYAQSALTAGDGINIASGTVSVKAGTGVTVDANGVSVSADWVSEQIDDTVAGLVNEGDLVEGSESITVSVSSGKATVSINETWLTSKLDKFYETPLYFDTGDGEYELGEVHMFVPQNATSVQLLVIEADGSGTSGLSIAMDYDIGTSSSMTLSETATDCSAYAGRAVVFTVSGTSDQTEIAALIRFNY